MCSRHAIETALEHRRVLLDRIEERGLGLAHVEDYEPNLVGRAAIVAVIFSIPYPNSNVQN
jgi:hypothetical protein